MQHLSYTCHSYYYLYHKYIFSVVENSGAAGSLYLIYWSVYVDLTGGKTSFYLPEIVKEKNSSIDQRKIEFVKKSKVTIDVKSEEISFLFIYYFKNFGKIKLVS